MTATRTIKTWTETERLEAQMLAEELLCQRVPITAIVKTLVAEYVITADAARAVIDIADEAVAAALAARAKYRRPQLLAGLDRLFEKAMKKDSLGGIREATKVAELIAKVEGHMRPQKVELSDPRAAGGMFANRSEDECDYYSQHGHFPEEQPGASAQQPTGAPTFPLDRELRH